MCTWAKVEVKAVWRHISVKAERHGDTFVSTSSTAHLILIHAFTRRGACGILLY